MFRDELVDLDEERLRVLDILMRQKERVAKSYNKKSQVENICFKWLGLESDFAYGQEK